MAQIISVFSPKGGVGRTFIATNLAVILAERLKNKKTILLDIDLQIPGDTSKILDLKPTRALAEIAADWQQGKYSLTHLREYIVKHSLSNLDFMPLILNLREKPLIKGDFLSYVLKDLSQEYEFIIADAGKTFCDTLVSVLDQTNLILLVVNPDLLSVYQAKESIDILQSLFFPLSMIKVVLNRAESLGGVAWREVKTALPCEIIAQIPSEGRIVGTALNSRIPVVLDSPRSRVSLALYKLGDTLISQSEIYISSPELRGAIAPVREEGFLKEETISFEKGMAKEKPQEAKKPTHEDKIDELKGKIHQRIIQELDLRRLDRVAGDLAKIGDLRHKTVKAINKALTEEADARILIASREERERLVKEITDEALGLGPLEDLINDPGITDILVNNKDQIFLEKEGRLQPAAKRFVSNEQVRQIIERIIAPLGRRIDESVPMVDGRLPDGSRVNAIIPPLSLTGPTLTIRKFGSERLRIHDLEKLGTLDKRMNEFLKACVLSRKNIIVSGGTGSGKTTVLNILSEFISDAERIITIEDAAELKLHHQHCVRLESRLANIEGRGAITMRDLFRNSLRMRPDRIIIGECRGAETLDMLQAMNTGHDGSMTTLHANSTQDVLARIDSLILMSGIEIPLRAIREMIASAIHMIVHTARLSDGSRKVLQITEVKGMIDEMHIGLEDIFVFSQTEVDPQGKIHGEFRPTGTLPTFFEEFQKRGIAVSKDIFIP